MRTQRSALIPILAAVLALTGAAVAIAHTEVKSTSPAKGGIAKTSITRVTVTFTGALRRGTVRVVGAGGKVVSKGTGGRDPRNINRLLVGVKGGLGAGSYKASWTIIAADGHNQRGSFTFRLKR